MINKKLSIGITITNVTPAHTYFKIFANTIPDEQAHTQATRASLGSTLCLRNEEVRDFMLRLSPDIVILMVKDLFIDPQKPAIASLNDLWGMAVEVIQPATDYAPTYYRFVYDD